MLYCIVLNYSKGLHTLTMPTNVVNSLVQMLVCMYTRAEILQQIYMNKEYL